MQSPETCSGASSDPVEISRCLAVVRLICSIVATLSWLTGIDAGTSKVTRIRARLSGSAPMSITRPTLTPPKRTSAPRLSPMIDEKSATKTLRSSPRVPHPRIIPTNPAQMTTAASTMTPALISVAVKLVFSAGMILTFARSITRCRSATRHSSGPPCRCRPDAEQRTAEYTDGPSARARRASRSRRPGRGGARRPGLR